MCRTLKKLDSERAYRRSLGRFPTGVAIATTVGRDGEPVGLTINSFHSISLAPPLVGWSIATTANTYRHFLRASKFTVSVLARNQTDYARLFSTPGADRFSRLPVRNGSVQIPGSSAVFYCTTYRRLTLGDHMMIVGKVIGFEHYERSPLLFVGGQFHQLPDAA